MCNKKPKLIMIYNKKNFVKTKFEKIQNNNKCICMKNEDVIPKNYKCIEN